jgi:hypothetical protein
MRMISIVFCIYQIASAAINYESEQSNFMGVSISQDDVNSVFAEFCDAGLLQYNSGLPYLSTPINTPGFASVWYYNVRIFNDLFPAAISLSKNAQGAVIIGFRLQGIRAALNWNTGENPDQSILFTSLNEFPICQVNEFIECSIHMNKNPNDGSFSINLEKPSVLKQTLYGGLYGSVLDEFVFSKIPISALGNLFQGLKTELLAQTEPLLDVSDGKLLVGISVHKEKRPDITPIINLLLD